MLSVTTVLRRLRSRAGKAITSVLSLCSLASLVMTGFEVDGPEVLSEDALTHGAGPGSGRSRPMLCRIAQIRALWACSVAGLARRKWSTRSPNSVCESSPGNQVRFCNSRICRAESCFLSIPYLEGLEPQHRGKCPSCLRPVTSIRRRVARSRCVGSSGWSWRLWMPRRRQQVLQY